MMGLVKDEARQMLEKLPEDATWDDLMYEIYVKKKVADGQEAAGNGRLVPHGEARERLGKK
jgi:tetraacyldisaccharide-1-P 4'-kinase